jgi:hypothetical protein
MAEDMADNTSATAPALPKGVVLGKDGKPWVCTFLLCSFSSWLTDFTQLSPVLFVRRLLRADQDGPQSCRSRAVSSRRRHARPGDMDALAFHRSAVSGSGDSFGTVRCEELHAFAVNSIPVLGVCRRFSGIPYYITSSSRWPVRTR